jgi:hypothetical protein
MAEEQTPSETMLVPACFPDELAREVHQGTVWFEYLKQAVKRETGREPRLLRRDWMRFFTELVEDGLDPWLLACALDLLAMRWVREVKSALAVIDEEVTVNPWLCAKPYKLLAPIRALMPRNKAYWRHVWLSRLCDDDAEAAYCQKWLGALEDALTAFEVIDYEMAERAERQLVKLENERLCLRKQTGLTRRADAPGYTFKLHYLAELVRE